MLPDDVKFPVLSHQHSPNPPLHKLPVCGRWSQVVAPRWRVGKIPAEFYPSCSYTVNSCVRRLRFQCSLIRLRRRYPTETFTPGVYYDCIVYVIPCNYLYQYLEMFRRCHGNDTTDLALFCVTRGWHLLQRSQARAQQTVSRHDQQNKAARQEPGVPGSLHPPPSLKECPQAWPVQSYNPGNKDP